MAIYSKQFSAPLLCFALLFLGCSGPADDVEQNSADALIRQRIDKVNQITDMMASGATESEIQIESDNLETIEMRIDEKEATMSSYEWDKLLDKHNDADWEAMGRRIKVGIGDKLWQDEGSESSGESSGD